MTCATEPSVATEREDDPQPAAESAAAATKGPPSLYTAELAERILREVEGGRSLHDVCRDDGIPGYSTVHTWVSRDYHGFAARHASAREIGYAGRDHGTIYTEELAERVLQELSNGRALCDSVSATTCRPRARCGSGSARIVRALAALRARARNRWSRAVIPRSTPPSSPINCWTKWPTAAR